jgi:hypothetical protein
MSGNIDGYNAARLTFEFAMLAPDASVVDCSISSAALDVLAGHR